MTQDALDDSSLATRQEIHSAVSNGKLEELKDIFAKHPDLMKFTSEVRGNWVCEAVRSGNREIVEYFLDQGGDINCTILPEESTPLALATFKDNFNMAELLLKRGANPNIGRPIISAMNIEDDELRMRMVKLLVDNGADVNRLHDLYGDPNQLFTALDWAGTDLPIREYLLAQGGKTADEVRGKSAPPPAVKASRTMSEQVVDYFAREFGPVDKAALLEIVPDTVPITIHVIPPTPTRKVITLFTTGLSAKKMTVPKDIPRAEDYALAELFIELPVDWKYKELDDPNWSWPVHQLRWLGKYPHAEQTWLGMPITVVAHGDPPTSLAPNTRCDSLLLVPQKDFRTDEGLQLQLYRLMPLYPEERELEATQGYAALMKALDRASAPFVVDLNRKNAAQAVRRK